MAFSLSLKENNMELDFKKTFKFRFDINDFMPLVENMNKADDYKEQISILSEYMYDLERTASRIIEKIRNEIKKI